MEAVTIAKAETEEKCKLLDESKTELEKLGMHFNSEKSALMEAVNIAKAENE